MKAFNADRRCPKCWYDAVRSEWKPAQNRFEAVVAPYAGVYRPAQLELPERIVRTCSRCEHSWDEKPLHTEPPEGDR